MRSVLLAALLSTLAFAGCLSFGDSDSPDPQPVTQAVSEFSTRPDRQFEPVLTFAADQTEQFTDHPITFTIDITDLQDYEFPVDFIDWTVTIYDQEKPIQEGDGAQLPYSFEWTPNRDTTFWAFFNYDDSQGMDGFLGPIRIRTIDEYESFPGLDVEGRVESPYEYSPENAPVLNAPQHCPDVSLWNPPDDRIPAMNGIFCWVQPLPDLASGHGITITSSTDVVNGWLTRDCGTSTDAADLQEFIGEFSPYKTTVPFEGCLVLFETAEATGADFTVKMKPDRTDPLEHLATLPDSYDGGEAPHHPIDDDLDGISNFEDDCREAAGPAEHNGCPDTDGDGLIDKEDLCPEEPGPEEDGGCPTIGAEPSEPVAGAGVIQREMMFWHSDHQDACGIFATGDRVTPSASPTSGAKSTNGEWVVVDPATWGQTFQSTFGGTTGRYSGLLMAYVIFSGPDGIITIYDDGEEPYYEIDGVIPEGADRAYHRTCGTTPTQGKAFYQTGIPEGGAEFEDDPLCRTDFDASWWGALNNFLPPNPTGVYTTEYETVDTLGALWVYAETNGISGLQRNDSTWGARGNCENHDEIIF